MAPRFVTSYGVTPLRVAAGSAAVLALMMLFGPSATAQPAPELSAVPAAADPILIRASNSAGDGIEISPPIQRVPIAGSTDFVLTNHGPTATFDLTVTDIAIDSGVERVAGRRDDITLAASSVTLARDEAATVPIVVAPGARAGVAGIQARVRGASPATEVGALLVLGPASDVAIDVMEFADEAVDIAVTTNSPDVLDVTVRVTSWPGLASTTTTARDVIVTDGRRPLRVDVAGLAVGRLDIEVAATSFDTTAFAPDRPQATVTASYWRLPVWLVATTLLVMSAAVALLARRRLQALRGGRRRDDLDQV